MERREFLGFVGASLAGAFLPEIKPTNENDWTVHYCPSGTTLGENLQVAIAKAKHEGKDVIFTFNYDEFYMVKPDGSWSNRVQRRPRLLSSCYS